jgi:hypothetical protein
MTTLHLWHISPHNHKKKNLYTGSVQNDTDGVGISHSPGKDGSPTPFSLVHLSSLSSSQYPLKARKKHGHSSALLSLLIFSFSLSHGGKESRHAGAGERMREKRNRNTKKVLHEPEGRAALPTQNHSPTQPHTGEHGNVYVQLNNSTTDRYHILLRIISVGLDDN